MFSSNGFSGVLGKMNAKGGPVPVLKLGIKHKCEGEIQNFLDSVEKTYNVPNLKDLFITTVQWDKISFNHWSYQVNVVFDEITFTAFLTGLQINRKVKKGVESFEYTLNIEKTISSDNLDQVLATEYLNRKEEDEDGKQKLVLYNVKLSPFTDKEDDSEPDVM